jgi:hypothetical protein
MMETKKQPTGFEKCLKSADRRIAKIKAVLEETQIFYQNKNIESAYLAAFELADQSERLTNLTRVIPAYTGHPRAKEMMEEAMLKVFPIEIGFTAEGWFCVRLPALMPKKNRGSPAYITDPMYPAMIRFWRGKPPVRYPYNVTVFRHVYSLDRPERQFRDHDNIELNRILDIIALYVMVDDSPMRCRHYYYSAPGDSNRTEVYVVPQDEFMQWIIQENNIPYEGVKLYENRP